MFKHDPTDTKPCPHMRVWVSALADEALTGLARWYTEHHVAACPQCRKGLTAIVTLRERLHTVHETAGDDVPLSPEQWTSVESAWAESEATRRPNP